VLGLPIICVEYGLETRPAQNERIHVLELDFHLNCAENVHVTLLGTKEEIRVFSLDVQSIFPEYWLET